MTDEPSESLIPYDEIVQEALRDVVGRVLGEVEQTGELPGGHHFYITFKTRLPGVSIPKHLAERFPDEMTIVIQHRFWDLKVGDDGFSVGLSFGGVPSTLRVPFAAVTQFHDPAVEFSLTFHANSADELHDELSLWDKRKSKIMTLSGGMKRRVMIAKALAHEPEILFLDEPTAGVDVELRRDMWALVRRLRDNGATIILTTHYIDEAEEMADRIGVINKGELVVVEEKAKLMRKLGKKELTVNLQDAMAALPAALADWPLVLSGNGTEIRYTFDAHEEQTGIPGLLRKLAEEGINYRDLNTRQSSLEEIFVNLVSERKVAQ